MQKLYLMNAAPFLEEARLQNALALVEPRRREHIMQIQDKKSRALSLAAGVLLCYAVNVCENDEESLTPIQADTSQVLGILREREACADFTIPETIAFTNGKPYFKELPGVFFNLSHSGEYVACALADCEIGVDIQQYKKNIKAGVINRVLSEREKEAYQICREEEKECFFFRIWAAKEACAKYTGEGLGMDFRQLCTDFSMGEITDSSTGKTYGLQMWEKLPGYAVALVSHGKEIQKG